MIQALVFDLDNTLYLESDFVTSGYRAVARHISEHYGCCLREVFHTMMSVFVAQGRENVLPVILRRFLADKVPLSELVEIYRNHTPRIRLFPGYSELLNRLGKSYKLGMITDGLPEVQKRKVRALGLEEKMERIIYSWEHCIEKPEPHPQLFSLIMEYLRSNPLTTLYIGHSLEEDSRGAHSAGMRCVQVVVPFLGERRSETIPTEKPDYVLDSLLQLPPILQAMEKT